jgi:hypothetical protein
MISTTQFATSPSVQIKSLLVALESLTDGELAVELLIAFGVAAILPLEELLLKGKASTVALPRCRVARSLGGLQAWKSLLKYFQQFDMPTDPAVLFAEDAVRSAVARELLRWKDDDTFQTLVKAAKQRATLGIIEAVGEFARLEAIPLLFEKLEDDFCARSAFAALCRTPEASRQYAILSIQEKTDANVQGPGASRRRRASAELVRQYGVSREEWSDVSRWLQDDDPAVVIGVASAGGSVASEPERMAIVRALFRVAKKCNWLQEDDVVRLLCEHKAVAQSVATQILRELKERGERCNLLSPAWRVLCCLLPPEQRKPESSGHGQTAVHLTPTA